MVSRSGYLNRVVFQRRRNMEKRTSTCIQIDDLPGGPEIFQLVVKFCYGWKVDVVESNVAPLLCAATFLEMSDDLEPGNPISKTESFLSFVILAYWKETCIAHWTAKWLSRITSGLDNQIPKHLNQQLLRATTESLIRILPAEGSSVSCNFLLHLLKFGLTMKVNSELSNKLEKRLSFLLEHCRVPDLLVRNYGENDTVYDVGIIIMVVKTYASSVLGNSESRIFTVVKLVDGFLTLVARDKNLTVQNFQSLIEALPRRAGYCNDKLYRAVDMYLKVHPNITEEERTSVTRAMEYHKLSQEARQHTMLNNRLPLKTATPFMHLEQVNMKKSMTAAGSNRRTKTQTVIRASRGSDEGWVTSQNEIKMMKKEVEIMKVQLNKLQMCKKEIQRQARRCITDKMKLGKIGAV